MHSAIEQTSPEKRASSWASNIGLVRRALHDEKSVRFDEGKCDNVAVDEAMQIVRSYYLNVEWPIATKYLDPIYEKVFKGSISFVSSALGIPGAIFKVLWFVIQRLGPGYKQIPAEIADKLNESSFHLRRRAEMS